MRRTMDRVGGTLILACLFASIGSQPHTSIKVAFQALNVTGID